MVETCGAYDDNQGILLFTFAATEEVSSKLRSDSLDSHGETGVTLFDVGLDVMLRDKCPETVKQGSRHVVNRLVGMRNNRGRKVARQNSIRYDTRPILLEENVDSMKSTELHEEKAEQL
jgi:hypothetical protein